MTNKLFKMTWCEKPVRRWVKIYKGQRKYFPVKRQESQATSYQRCWAECQAWIATIAVQSLPQSAAHARLAAAIEQMRMMKQWFDCRLDDPGHIEESERLGKNIANLSKRKHEKEPELDRWEQPLAGVSQSGKLVWEDRFREMKRVASSNVATAGATIDNFLSNMEALVQGKQRSAGRFGNLAASLKAFVIWFGANRPLTDINEMTLVQFHAYLIKKIKDDRASDDCGDKNETISEHTAFDRLRNLKQFIRNCAELGMIPLPRNINSRSLSISIHPKEIQTFTVEEVKRLYLAASDWQKLFVLLFVNTSMQQKDISSLRQDEVDWEKGRIKRSRSKHRHHKNAPVIEWKLWPETLKLLRANRSQDKTLALLNHDGNPLVVETLKDGMPKKLDAIHSAFDRLLRKVGIDKPPKLLRKTSPSLLETHTEFSRFANYFLGNSPRGVAERHYLKPSTEQFHAAVMWLRDQYRLFENNGSQQTESRCQ